MTTLDIISSTLLQSSNSNSAGFELFLNFKLLILTLTGDNYSYISSYDIWYEFTYAGKSDFLSIERAVKF